MFADVSPALVEVGPGEICTIAVRITNTTTMIDGYQVSLFGLDPEWVTVTPSRLSLFPDEIGNVELQVHLPASFPAGHRQLSVHVRSENDPANFALTSLGLLALGQHRVRLRIDPAVVTGGSDATFGLIVNNDGNTTIAAVGSASDPEEMATITLAPAAIELPPGQQSIIEATVRAKRPWFGQPKVRVVTFAVDSTTKVEAMATFIQRPRISRWVMSLMGLLAAAAVFAAVLSRTFDTVVDEATVDKGLLTEALDKGGEGGQMVPVDPGGLAGKVVLFSTGDGVAGVQADLFTSDNVKVPISTSATSEDGSFAFGRLNAGTFKVRFSGAGFNELWYESGTTAADAVELEVELGKVTPMNDVTLGGRPGSVAGTVEADDLTGINATLVVPGTVTDDVPAEVLTLPVSADGKFLFEKVPSPASYQLIVSKPGYATETRSVALGPAQAVDNITIVLRKGDGVIRGRIANLAGPLGGATIEATDGVTTVSTVSLTDGEIGAFALRSLANPQAYTLTISRPGYRTETRTVSLTTAQDLDTSAILLERSTGSLGGTVSQVGIGPVGGVAVTISAGDTTITTFTASTGVVGSYFVDEIPIPATYTLTFAKTGLSQQVRIQDLDPANQADSLAIDVALPRNTANIEGVVRGVDNSPVPLATVTLSDGTTQRVLSTANDPLGRFSFTNVAPGAYTISASLPGTSASVRLVNVIANTDQDLDISLSSQASVTGQVLLLTSPTTTTTTPATTTTTPATGPPTTPDPNATVPPTPPATSPPTTAPPTSATYVPYAGATVRLFLAANFPTGTPVATKTTDINGLYTFDALEAPQNYVVAVYQTNVSPDPLDSLSILTQPATQLTVPIFQIPVLF